MGVKNLIIGASYSNECNGKSWSQKVRDAAEAERRQGKLFNNHYIVRDNKELADPVKFLWPLHGVPILAYCYVNALRSRASRVVVVGNKIVGGLIGHLNAEFGQEIRANGKNIHWAYEGDTWSLHNTLSNGMNKLQLAEGERTGFLCADTPLFHDLDALLDDKNNDVDALLDCNGFENMFPKITMPGPFPRSYHISIAAQNGPVHCKEPNAYILSNNKAVLDVLETAFGARKTGYGGGLGPAFIKLCLRKAHTTLPYMLWHEFDTVVDIAGECLRYLTQGTRGEYRPFNWRVASFRDDHLSTLASRAIGARVRIKAGHKDPARLLDIDSLEDYAYVATLLDEHPDVYPHQQDIRRVRENVIRPLGDNHILTQFNHIIDQYASRVGVPQLFHDGRHKKVHTVFPQYTKEMIDSCAKALLAAITLKEAATASLP